LRGGDGGQFTVNGRKRTVKGFTEGLLARFFGC
jgi:hypothetical protein